MTVRPFGVVQHEAAHVVVGVSLGARLRASSVTRWSRGGDLLVGGWTWFPHSSDYQDALITAAGIAWERAVDGGLAAQDEIDLRTIVGRSRVDFESCVIAAGAILETRATAHARVVRALLEHDLTHADIERLARGENPTRLREEDT